MRSASCAGARAGPPCGVHSLPVRDLPSAPRPVGPALCACAGASVRLCQPCSPALQGQLAGPAPPSAHRTRATSAGPCAGCPSSSVCLVLNPTFRTPLFSLGRSRPRGKPDCRNLGESADPHNGSLACEPAQLCPILKIASLLRRPPGSVDMRKESLARRLAPLLPTPTASKTQTVPLRRPRGRAWTRTTRALRARWRRCSCGGARTASARVAPNGAPRPACQACPA